MTAPRRACTLHAHLGSALVKHTLHESGEAERQCSIETRETKALGEWDEPWAAQREARLQ
jgi:hypothetical protein